MTSPQINVNISEGNNEEVAYAQPSAATQPSAPVEPSNKKKKKKGNKKDGRTWERFKDKAFMNVLKIAVACGLKSENGWKANYKAQLKMELDKVLPGTDLQVDPHISSKLKQWGKEYACVSSIKDKSGAGWIEGEKRLNIDEDMWRAHAQNWKGMISKKDYCWPFYYDWEYVFGKDRANGHGVFSVKEASKRFIPDHIINKAKKNKTEVDEDGVSGDEWYDGDDGASNANPANRSKSNNTGSTTPTADDGL